ncbi:ATP-dependent DNA helicase chl1 [Desmophyllum pertusum]|uniref:ATP-dependent DNA helicase chl1 n=1 Tax=Desmophyllum pertusum TaxID=174260 RepID=A0A9W9YXZ2_9CNID|nr:ATP-dependent DNA helicase chl1 [Desmophyllum pertusum]
MDTSVKEAKTRSTEKRLSDNLHKANSILSVFAILMTIALFVRIETKTKVIDLQIQQIKDVLKVEEVTQARVKEDVDITSGKVCVAGPPGPKGIQGNRGKRGPKGTEGKKGTKGIMGTVGDAGAAGHPGHPGPKGEPGESISAPELVNNGGQDNKLQISTTGYNDSGSYVCKAANVLGQVQKLVKLFVEVPPRFVETPDRVIRVLVNTVASISCRAFGFPSPTIVWSRGLVSLPQGRTTITNGTLNISNFSPQDSGPYQCKATNKLGSVSSLTTLNIVQPGDIFLTLSNNTRRK